MPSSKLPPTENLLERPLAKTIPKSIDRWIPAIGSLRNYSLTFLRRDTIAGLTVAAVAVPQAMAYASIFGVPVEYGLYTAIVMTGVGALFDSSKKLINGPTNAISIAMLSALAAIPAESHLSAAILMAFMIGAIQTLITLLRLGDLSRYISHAVVVGFTLGASVLLVLDQLKNALGLKSMGSHSEHFIKRFWLTMTQGGSVHMPTLLIAISTISVALLIRRLNRSFRLAIPELLVSIVFAGTAVWYLNLGANGVKLVDRIPRSLPSFATPNFDFDIARQLLWSAFAVGLLGLLEAIAMAKSLAAKTREKLDINQQCLSEGLANMAGSFFQCFPGSGSLTRSYINHQAGAATQWSGVVCAIAVGLTIIAFAPMAQYIPRSALAAVLLLTATRMVDLPALSYHLRATRFDAAIVIVTAFSAVLVSVEFCILIGVLLSFLMYIPRAASVEVTELMLTRDGMIRERSAADPPCDRVKIFNFEGEMFFGSSPDFESHLERIEADTSPRTRVVVIRFRYVRNPDAVCLELLDHFVERMQKRNVLLAFSGVRKPFFRTLERTGIVEKVGYNQVFRELSKVWSSTSTAVSWAYEQLNNDRCDHCPRNAANTGESAAWQHMI